VINIYNQDCMDAMAGFKDNQFDLAIVDPPYKEDVKGLKAGLNRSQFNYKALTTPPNKRLYKRII